MKTIEEVVASFPKAVQDAFDFGNATYKGALVPIEGIVCRKHGEFRQYVSQLRKQGALCPKCGNERRALSKKLDPAEFVRRAEAVHPGRFTYEKTSYVSMKAKVVVTCPLHGDFSISPIKLVHGGQGCPTCGSELRGHHKDATAGRLLSAATKRKNFGAMFEQRAKKVHGDLYDYSEHGYTSGRSKVKIICRKHGAFEQAVYHHLNGQGCPNCGQKSSQEDALARFLSVFVAVQQRDRTLIKPRELDIYMPEQRLAVEYCGMYWHSHGDKDDERKNKLRHFEKHQSCAEHGVRLLTIYESEWQERPYAIKRLLRNAVGRSKGKLMARKCELRKVETQEARAFYDKYHPQGGAGNGTHYALFWKGKMVACMRFAMGANDRGNAKDRVWTLGRYATRVNVAGAASRLFKAFVAEHNPPVVKSFSDNRLFGGGMYEKLGFALEADVAPDYQVWSPKFGLRPKPYYQRRNLQRRLQEHGMDERYDHESDLRTETEMTYLMGARRIYDCGKKRWVWTP